MKKEALPRKLLSVKPQESMALPSKTYGRCFGKLKSPEINEGHHVSFFSWKGLMVHVDTPTVQIDPAFLEVPADTWPQ